MNSSLLLTYLILVGSCLTRAKYRYNRVRDVSIANDYNKKQMKPYNHYVLAFQWPNTICSVHQCTNYSRDKKFTLHGLWPSATKGPHVQNCSYVKLQKRFKQSKLFQRISKNWIGLYHSTDSFLRHEWNKHGTCFNIKSGNTEKMPSKISRTVRKYRKLIGGRSNKDLLVESYFSVALSLFEEYNPKNILSVDKIVPQSGKAIKLWDIKRSFTKHFGKDSFQVICYNQHGKSMIQEIRICLSLNYRVQSCNRRFKDVCKSDVVYN